MRRGTECSALAAFRSLPTERSAEPNEWLRSSHCCCSARCVAVALLFPRSVPEFARSMRAPQLRQSRRYDATHRTGEGKGAEVADRARRAPFVSPVQPLLTRTCADGTDDGQREEKICAMRADSRQGCRADGMDDRTLPARKSAALRRPLTHPRCARLRLTVPLLTVSVCSLPPV